MSTPSKLLVTFGLFAIVVCAGCAPATFVKGQPPGWKTIELNPATRDNFDIAWEKTVDTIALSYDIEMMDKQSGYLRTSWTYGISGGTFQRYRGRLTIKFPTVNNPKQINVKTEAHWLYKPSTQVWWSGWDSAFQRDVVTALSGRLGRTVPES